MVICFTFVSGNNELAQKINIHPLLGDQFLRKDIPDSVVG